MPVPDHLWDENEVARYLGSSVYAVRKWRHNGKLGFIKLGSSVRFDPQEIRVFAEKGRVFPICPGCKKEIPQRDVKLPAEVDPNATLYAAG